MAAYLRLWKPIVIAALIVGVADLFYAFIHIGRYFKLDAMQILQSIARGLIGPRRQGADGARRCSDSFWSSC